MLNSTARPSKKPLSANFPAIFPDPREFSCPETGSTELRRQPDLSKSLAVRQFENAMRLVREVGGSPWRDAPSGKAARLSKFLQFLDSRLGEFAQTRGGGHGQGFDNRQGDARVPMRWRRDATGQYVFCLAREGRKPLVGDQHDFRPTRRGGASERNAVLLIAPDIEDERCVPTFDVEQALAPHASVKRPPRRRTPRRRSHRREFAAILYDAIIAAGAPRGLRLAGYRANGTLRLEKGYRAWGTEIGPDHALW
jgi:hypothetical protein